MNVDSEDNIVSFHLQIKLLCGSDIYLYNITSQHTMCMVKTLLTERVGLREIQQRLFLLTTILDDGWSLASYNIDNYSIIMVVKIPRGGVRTRHTAVLRVNDNSEVYLDTILMKVTKMMKELVNVLIVMNVVHMVLIVITVKIYNFFLCNDWSLKTVTRKIDNNKIVLLLTRNNVYTRVFSIVNDWLYSLINRIRTV